MADGRWGYPATAGRAAAPPRRSVDGQRLGNARDRLVCAVRPCVARLRAMSEPEPSPAIRRLFEELEAEFEASLRREADQQTVAALRAQAAETLLWEALARRVGSDVAVQAGPRWFRGTLVASYPDFFVIRDRLSRTQYLVRLGPAVSVALPPEPQALRLLPAPPRYRFILALRELARRREPVRLELADGNDIAGTIEVVGNDHLEIAEHNFGEARRQTALTGRRLLALAAVAVVTLPPDSR
jgi:hypothetical protein